MAIIRRSDIAKRLQKYVLSVQGKTGKVNLDASDVKAEAVKKSNLVATTNPQPTDDSSKGYEVLSKWMNNTTGAVFTCLETTHNNAIWKEDDIKLTDLGSAALKNIGEMDDDVALIGTVKAIIPTQQTTSSLGIDQVDNTRDVDKPVSTAQALAISEALDMLMSSMNDVIESRMQEIDYSTILNTPKLFSGKYTDLTDIPVGFDGDYNSLHNKPVIFDGKYSSLTGTPILFNGDFNSLSNVPHFFDGKFGSLTEVPVLFDGQYENLKNKPFLFSGEYTDLKNKPLLFDGKYTSLTNLPVLFNGNYDELSNKPVLFNGNYSSLKGLPTLFSGSWNDLSNKPTIPSSTTNISEGNNLYYTSARVKAYLDSKSIKDVRYYDVTSDASGNWTLDVSTAFSYVDFVVPMAISTNATATPVITDQKTAHLASFTTTGVIKGTVTKTNTIVSLLLTGTTGAIFGGVSTIKVKVEGTLK